MYHVTITTRIRKLFKQHTQAFRSTKHRPLWATENRWNAEDLCLNRQIVFLNTKFRYAFFVAEIVWRVFLVAVERKWWIFWVIYVVKNGKFVTLSIKETKFSIPCRCRAEMVDIFVYLCRIEWQICDSLNKGNQK